MEILGIGPLEFLLILAIALLVLGPKDMVKAGRTVGRFLRKVVTSPEWRTMQQASRELSRLPNRLIREAGLEEAQTITADIRRTNPEEVIGEIAGDFKRWQEDVSEEAAPPILSDNPPEPLPPSAPPAPPADIPQHD